MFEGFTEFDLATTEGSIHGRRGGQGPPALLLHGIPETHLMWHHVGPRLAEHVTVVATDLRGFGASTSPPASADHAVNSMRAIAAEQVEIMSLLGFDRFAVVGHDRVARCAYRMAIAFPQDIRAAYTDALKDPATVAAICEEYRPAATLDVEHDDQVRGRRPITCPVLALWSATGATAAWYEPISIWREWAHDVTGTALDCGHFLPEEAPDETSRHLLTFLS